MFARGIFVLVVLLRAVAMADPPAPPVPSPASEPIPSERVEDEKAGLSLRGLIQKVFPSFDENVDENQSGPAAFESDAADLLKPEDLLSEEQIRKSVPWRAPDYDFQKGALGWAASVFEIPKGLEGRVQFWKDVYTKYTSDQGILHDRFNYDIVYEWIDFGPIMLDRSKTNVQKAILRERLVNAQRKDVMTRLLRLQQVSSPQGLEGKDLRIWKLYESINDSQKFKHAAN